MSIDDHSLCFARRLATIKAGQLLKTLRPLEREDIEQELLTEVILRWPRFDALRGSTEAFIEEVVRGKVCKLLRSRRRCLTRQRRGAPIIGASLSLADSSDPIRGLSLRMDIQAVCQRLPAPLSEACQRLGIDTQTDVAKSVGLSRNGLANALSRSRDIFVAHDLDSYL